MDNILEFTSNHTLLVVALMISFFLIVFTELRRKASGLVNVDPIHAVKLINNDALVIDLRSSDAFSQGHIVGAKNIPSDQLDARLDQLQQPKAQPIVAVCDVGMSSTKAVNALRASGFESTYGLKGGMSGWREAGLPVVSGKKTKAKHHKEKNNKKDKSSKKK